MLRGCNPWQGEATRGGGGGGETPVNKLEVGLLGIKQKERCQAFQVWVTYCNRTENREGNGERRREQGRGRGETEALSQALSLIPSGLTSWAR